jgi:DNA-binding MarR family transcriptional regulator
VSSMEYPVRHGADRLLRQMGRQAESKYEPIVVPREAAEKLNIDPESPVYVEAVNRLLESGYLERTHNPALGTTMGTYRLTEKGLAKARELRGV